MNKILTLCVLVVLILACNLPLNFSRQSTPAPIVVVVTSAPTPAPQKQPSQQIIPTQQPIAAPTAGTAGYTTTMSGITMTIPDCIIMFPSVDTVPAQLPEGPGEVWPEHRVISLSGYPDQDKFFTAIIRILPLDTYPVVDNTPASLVANLKNVLATKPYTSLEPLPILPVFYANQAFRLKIDYLDFQNGKGVRFLTEYAQYYVPMNNHDLFYAFQGLTSDNRYWVSAILPISHSILPATAETTSVPPGGLPIPDWNSPTLDTDFATYYAGMSAIINGQPDSSFSPSITCLDQFIQSLKID